MLLVLSLYFLSVILQIASIVICFSLFHYSIKVFSWGWLLLAIGLIFLSLKEVHIAFTVFKTEYIQFADVWLSLFSSLFLLCGVLKIKRLLFKKDNKIFKLETIAQFDTLTQSLSRRAIRNLIYEEINRSKRSKNSFALMEMDIDFFKHINDKFGHMNGDLVLIDLVKHTKKVIRSIDALGRVGGEEFLILMPNTEPKAAIEIANRLRSYIAQSTYQLSSYVSVQITVSIGITIFEPMQKTDIKQDKLLDELIRQADMAMYEAKNNGRNRVAIWHIEHTIMPT